MKRISSLPVLILLFSAAALFPADWPCFRGDTARTGTTSENLAFPMEPVWVYKPAQAPQPAWPDPVFEENQTDFDYAPMPVAADGMILFGSSADDCVRALDLNTGTLKWRFITGGPVRFAPALSKSSAYVVSDDGYLYCLDLGSGKVKWKFNAAVTDRRLIGQGRIISRRPLRSGVLVDRGTVYTAAGMWPSGGVFVYALNPDTGEEIWCNDTSACNFIPQPHSPAAAMSGVSPQGYLAASENILLVPTGRGAPAAYDRSTGRLIHFQHGFHRLWTGAWVAVDQDKNAVITGQGRRKAQIDLRTGARDEKYFKNPDFGRIAPPREIRTADITIRGLDNAVAAYERGTKEIWRTPVEGEARGLASSDGRLIVSTSKGQIYCFGKAAGTPNTVNEQPSPSADAPADTQTEKIRTLMSENGIEKGYILLVGAEDAGLAVSLARASDLHVIVIPKELSQVAGIRNFLLDNTALYGSRVSVLPPDSLAPGILPPYFANIIIVAGMPDLKAQKNIYRPLSPCGGVMTMPGISAEQQKSLLAAASVPAGEIKAGNVVIRGKLEGAFDWDSKVTCDQRVKWPLELSWFGAPGPDLTVDRHRMGGTVPIPVVANGRVFQLGNRHLLAVDAYNGTVLWKVDIPYSVSPPYYMLVKHIAADNKSVYVDFGKVAYQLDARTGKQQKVYGEFKKPENYSLEKPQKFSISNPVYVPKPSTKKTPVTFTKTDEPPGEITLEKTSEGLKITMAVEKKKFLPFEGWELFFDFRPESQRMNLFEPGAFMLAVQTETALLRPLMMVEADGAWDKSVYEEKGGKFAGSDPVPISPSIGPVLPEVTIEKKKTDTGTSLVMTMPWVEIRRISGIEPGEFAFAATLTFAGPGISMEGEGSRVSGGQERFKGRKITTWHQTHLFSDRYSGVFNNGWAVFDIPGVPAQKSGSYTVPGRADLPRTAYRDTRDPSRPGDSVSLYTELPDRASRWGLVPSRTEMEMKNRLPVSHYPHPLTGAESVISYNRTYGCGGTAVSAAMDFLRSATLAYYDYRDESGFRNFGGVKTSCGKPGNIISAFGLFIDIEGSSGCNCAYNFMTSLVLAPTEYRSNEDWAVYDDQPRGKRTKRFKDIGPAEGASIKQYHLNPGAPGDRRDSQGSLWFGSPRTAAYLQTDRLLTLPVPEDVSGGNRFELYRFNADRRPVHGTDRQWLYSGGYRDVRTVNLALSYFDPYHEAMILSCESSPSIDGILDDPCWEGSHSVLLPSQNASALLRYDKDNLYIAYKGKASSALKNKLEGRDVPVWEDDSMELVFGAEKFKGRLCHFAVSAGNAKYDAIIPKFSKSAKEETSWNPDWKSAVKTDGNSFTVEAAIPWSVIETKGVKRDAMSVNFRHRECIAGKGMQPYTVSHAMILRDKKPAARKFTVRLHFAEVDNAKPGERVFDIAIQGKTVLKGLDIRKETGGADTALIKEFKGISAAQSIRIECIPVKGTPLLSAIEAVEEK